MYQTQIPYVKNLKEELEKRDNSVLDKVDALDSQATAETIVTFLNKLIVDMKAKGIMKSK